MGMPTPFEIGGAVGNNINRGFREAADVNAIDRILGEASESNNPKAMDDAIVGILRSVSPKNQPTAIEALKQKQEQILNKKSQSEQSRLADEIEKTNPDSKSHQLIANIYRADIPLEQKKVMLKSLSESVPFKAEQQQRLQMDSVLKRYNARIKEVEASIKAAKYSDRPSLEKQKKDLQDERDLLLDFKALKKDEEPVEEKKAEMTKVEKKEAKEKPVFDPENPEHMKRFEELEAQFPGDKEQINRLLNEEFA